MIGNKFFKLPMAAVFALVLTVSLHSQTVLVSGVFDGDSATNLNTTTPTFYSSLLTEAGGTGEWEGFPTIFKADGSVDAPGARSLYLDLGNYIENSKGQANALFQLDFTLDVIARNSLAVGFYDNGSKDASTWGLNPTNPGTTGVIRTNPAGDVEWYGVVDDSLGFIAEVGKPLEFRTIVDLRDYDGEVNFGRLTWIVDGVEVDTYDLQVNRGFQKIIITTSAAEGIYSDMTLTQIPEPSITAAVLGLSAIGLCLVIRRRR